MEDIKQRVLMVLRIIAGYSPMGHEGLDREVVCLLIRKSLEQLAFSSLIAHREVYARIHNDFAETWRVKRLLDRIEAIHPHFYPKPVAFSTIGTNGTKHLLDVSEGFLTRDEFVFLYDNCSEVLHAWNPFRPDPPVLNMERPIAEWINRIQRLLDLHRIHLVGHEDIWIVQMFHPEDGKVHAFVTHPVITD